jgi:hypothetical protein
MILGLITKPITIAVDVILAFIPKKILVLIIALLILAVYYNFSYSA